MSLFGAIVKTCINVVTLPVTLPLSILKDITDPGAYGTELDFQETKALIKQIKDEASDDD